MPKQTLRSRIHHGSRIICRNGYCMRSRTWPRHCRRTCARQKLEACKPRTTHPSGMGRPVGARASEWKKDSHCSKSDQHNITKYVFAILLNLPQGVMWRTARRGCARKYTPYKTAMYEHAAYILFAARLKFCQVLQSLVPSLFSLGCNGRLRWALCSKALPCWVQGHTLLCWHVSFSVPSQGASLGPARSGVRLERRKVDRLERRKVNRLERRKVTPTET